MPVTRAISAATLVAALCATALLLAPGAEAHWRPQPTTTAWQWQLQGKIDLSVDADVYEVDGFEVGAGTVAKLHRRGRRAICYLDVGSWESYRPDAKRFPKSVLGRAYEGYPDERWLDIRRVDQLAPILRSRFDRCRRKGFDAVEPDNLAGYENETGFPLTAADQLRFNRWIAREVHRRGMAVALKNDPAQVGALVGRFDFAVVEECFAYEECGKFTPFVEGGKAVFVAEYTEPLTAICDQAERLRFSVIHKDYDLFARPWEPCFR
jgi:hypothetical protein